MKIYNTLSKKKEEFVPIEEGKVRMYVCGPTVYNYIHIGNARPMIVFDTVRRYLEFIGYDVNYVSNFTDVDDKIIKKAIEEGSTAEEVSKRYIAECKKDMADMNVMPATTHPLATEEIGGMIQMISTLIEKGYAYVVSDGTVYYRTRKFADYGKLSHKNLDDLEAGHRSIKVVGDEKEDDLSPTPADNSSININNVYAMRPEVRSLELATQIYKQKVNVTRSEYLPSVALIGNYMATNPSVFNSFENKFKGMWNVGVMVSMPIWHWGEGIYKVKAAKAEARITQYQLDDAKEKIELQVSQSVFKVNEAAKKLIMAEKNLEKADENLRYATLGFEEGVIPASNVLEAHTAWLSAQSEKIDAQIDVKLTEIYLKKATGSLNVGN